MDIYSRMRHGLGVVAVFSDGDEFEYVTFRQVDAIEDDVLEFFDENQDDAALFVIHGRLATSGERGEEGVHPLDLDCPQCEIDMILHNGIYKSSVSYARADGAWEGHNPKLIGQEDMEDDGHEFTTNIDSEMIAHEFCEIPRTIEEADEFLSENPSIANQNGFVLFGSHTIFMYGEHYKLNKDCEMSRTFRDLARDLGPDDYRYVLTKKPLLEQSNEAEVPANA